MNIHLSTLDALSGSTTDREPRNKYEYTILDQPKTPSLLSKPIKPRSDTSRITALSRNTAFQGHGIIAIKNVGLCSRKRLPHIVRRQRFAYSYYAMSKDKQNH